MNIRIVICPVCLNKYNAGVVKAEEVERDGSLTVQCPHCKYWANENELREVQPKLKELLK